MATALKLGSRIRNLRRKQGLTQAKLAKKLGVSPSYVNLIEHDRRSVTAAMLIKVAGVLDLDLRALASGDEQRLMADLVEVFSDTVFEAHALSTDDARDLVASQPEVARSVLSLYRSLQETRDSLATLASRVSDGQETLGVEAWRLPSEEVSDLLQRHGNYFPELEQGTEELWQSSDLENHEVYRGLVDYLRRDHGVAVEVVRSGEERGALRRYDPSKRLITLSEVLPTRSRIFQLAHQIGLLTKGNVLDRIASDERLTTDESRRLCRVALANYYASAILMPYERFLEAARDQRYDIELLGHRFRASYEQVCHRLTSMRRPGQEGVPFHFVRVDIAGNISKRFSASGMQFARFSAACPKWNVHAAFLTPGRIRVQVSQMPDGSAWLNVARTVSRGEGGYRSTRALYSIGLGCSVDHARDLVYADGLHLESPDVAVPVGLTCRLCERDDCEQRAFPPLQRSLKLDENVRGFSFYAPVDE